MNLSIIFLLLIVIKFSSSDLKWIYTNVITNNTKNKNSLNVFFEKTLKKSNLFDDDRSVLLAFDTKELFLNEVAKRLPQIRIVNLKNLTIQEEKLEKIQNYLFLIDDLVIFENFLLKIQRSFTWTASAKFLIFYTGQKDLEILFKLAWKFYIINITVISSNYKIYTYFPFKAGDCENLRKNELKNNSKNLFPNKIPMYFNNCPMKTLIIIIPPYVINQNKGMEICVVKTVLKTMKMDFLPMKHNESHWGAKLSNGSYTNVFKKLYDNEAHMVIGMVFANYSLDYDFDSSIYYTQDYYAFFVPSALPIDPWKNFIYVFDLELWLLMFFSIILAAVVWWLVGITRVDPEGYDNFPDCLIKIWCIIFSSYNTQPNSILLRAIFLKWSLHCFLINSIYQSVLMSFLTRPAFEHQISTLEELIHSDLKYGGLYVIRTDFKDKKNEKHRVIYENFVNCPLNLYCINKTAEERNFAVAKNYRQMNYLIPKLYLDEKGNPKMITLKETIGKLMITMHFAKGFPLVKRYSEVLQRAVEGGLVGKCERALQGVRIGKSSGGHEVTAFSVNLMKPAFVALCIGNSLGFLIFIYELWKRRKLWIWKMKNNAIQKTLLET